MFLGRGGIWMFMERDMGIFCNNFLELGDPNQKSFFGRGGVYFYFFERAEKTWGFLGRMGRASLRGPKGGTHCFPTGRTGQEQKYKNVKNVPSLPVRQQPTPGGVGCCGWVG